MCVCHNNNKKTKNFVRQFFIQNSWNIFKEKKIGKETETKQQQQKKIFCLANEKKKP